MIVFRQAGDGLRLARYVPLGKILRNRKKQRGAKRLIRNYCLFLCLDALRRSGLDGALVRGDVRIQEGENLGEYDPDVLAALVEYLGDLKLAEVQKGERGRFLRLTRRGRDLLASPVGVPELMAAYRPVLERLQGLLRAEPQARTAALRDEKAVREASASLGFDFAYPVISGLIKACGVTSVFELGSSRMALFKYLCDRNGITGLGLDIDPEAVADSEESLRGTAYEGRLRAAEGDALAPATAEIPAVEFGAIVAVDLLHYYLRDRGAVMAALAGWREKLPASLFIIVEVCRRPGRDTARGPLPKLEYDLCHRLTGQALPTERDWLDVFGAANYRLARKTVFPSLAHGAFVFRSAG